MTQTATSPQRKPLLDEASFQQLLSAAYVLQEHNDRLRGKEVHADFAKNLSGIVETQKLIQTLQLDLEAAAKLVAERVQKITNASGAAIGIIEKGQLFYRAGTGSAAVDEGTRVAPDATLSAGCLSKGSALNYPDVTANAQARSELFRERDVKAFIAVPVYHAGQVAGVLELRFARANSYREADLRTAELMAGLLSEAMVTAARMKWRDALASERQSMLEALERIKPQLERLGIESPIEDEVAAESPEPPVEPAVAPRSETLAAQSAVVCSACGSDFFDETEAFCGICGAARPVASSHADVSVSQTNTPWITPYAAENPPNKDSRAGAAREENAGAKGGGLPASLQELIELSAIRLDSAARLAKREAAKTDARLAQTPVAPTSAESHLAPPARHDFAPASRIGSVSASQSNLASDHFAPPDHFALPSHFDPPFESEAAATEALRVVPVDPRAASEALQPHTWSSAKKTQQWLEIQRGSRSEWLAHQWQQRRANIYIGLAALILLMVISGLGIRPATTVARNGSSAVNGPRQALPEPNLTLFEKLLVNLGIAEAPPAPSYRGNPDTQVWVDVHTALYHCPGSALYGKTPDGRMTTQRDAQQDQFEPANRKACP